MSVEKPTVIPKPLLQILLVTLLVLLVAQAVCSAGYVIARTVDPFCAAVLLYANVAVLMLVFVDSLLLLATLAIRALESDCQDDSGSEETELSE